MKKLPAAGAALLSMQANRFCFSASQRKAKKPNFFASFASLASEYERAVSLCLNIKEHIRACFKMFRFVQCQGRRKF